MIHIIETSVVSFVNPSVALLNATEYIAIIRVFPIP